MVKAIWSFRQSTKEDISREDLILPLFHVIHWKKLLPTHQTILYVDSKFKSKFKEANILGYWDEVYDLEPMDDVYEVLTPSVNTLLALIKDAGYDVDALDGDEELNFEVPAQTQEGSEDINLIESDINMALHLVNHILPLIGNPSLNVVFWKLYADNPYKTPITVKSGDNYTADDLDWTGPNQALKDAGLNYNESIKESHPSAINKIVNLFKKK